MDEGRGVLNFPVIVSWEAKLKELLHRITSVEITLCSNATREFVKILKGDDGGELLRQYVRASPKCSELLDAWKLRQGKEGMSYIFELIANVLSHYEGKYKSNNAEIIAISRDLDKFARSLVAEYLGDVYKELNSKEAKRQKAALLLMASIVRRGPSLASEVSKCFDFKLAAFTKLAERKWVQNGIFIENSLRKLYVGFAMSFLEVGKPGLLRWVLQQKEMYSGVLYWLGYDDEETVIYVLSTLRDRVLVKEALIPPALRSVLFGIVTLEQLVYISGMDGGGPTADLAYNILVLVCTDPCNGLMPDLKKGPIPLRGNTKRIMGLMKKLYPAEVQYHRDLLFAIVNVRPSFGLSYLEEFPYNIEDYMSPSWFAVVSLAASLVSLIGNGLSREFFNSEPNDLRILGNMDVQNVMKCMFPRPFSRSMINKGLLHTDFLVKHGTLKLLMELLKLLDSIISASNCRSSSTNQSMQHIVSIKKEIQNDVQALLPDPQVLLTLLSSLDSCSKTHGSCLKRTGSHLKHRSRRNKMLKLDAAERDINIVVGGINSVSDVPLSGNEVTVIDAPRADVSEDEEDLTRIVGEIWGVEMRSMTPKEVEIYLHSKLLDALKYFHRIVPHALGGSFEFFVGLLNNPLELTVDLQVSILSLLMEYIEWHPNSEMPLRAPPILYKHLQSFIKLFIFSTVDNVRHGAYRLAKAAMFSTGAFDRNLHEIEAWLLFLPGHQRNKSSFSSLELEVLHSLCPIVISFLCDVVSTVGNNLVKYWDLLKRYVHSLKGVGDLSLDFSPLIMCVLEKCLRLICSKSGTYSSPEKSMVLIYMCNTLKFLLQTQVDAEFLSALLNKQLTEKLGGCDENEEVLCEWKLLKNFWLFVQSMSQQHGGCHFSCNERSIPSTSSFTSTLGEVERLLSNGGVGEIPGIAVAFISSILCVEVDEIVMNMPKLVIISHTLQNLPLSFLSSVFCLDHSAIFHAFELWPQMFYAGLDMAVSDLSGSSNNTASAGINCNQLFDTSVADGAAFSLFLKQVPFHLLFPAVMCMNGPCSSELSKMQGLLLDKLSECTSDCSLLNLRLVLHWTHRIQSYQNLNQSVEIEQLSNICVVLVRKLLAQSLVSECSSNCATSSGSCSLIHKIHEVAKITFTHPSVLISLSFPLGSVHNFAGNIENSFDGLNILFREEVHNCCSPIINILTMTLDYVWSISSTHSCASEARDVSYKELVKMFKSLQHRLFLKVKDKVNQFVCTKNQTHLLQAFYTLHPLVRFLSPFLLLELVDWMFSRVELDDFTAKNTAFSIGCSLAAGAFSALSYYLQLQIRDMSPYDIFWEINEKNIEAHLFEKIYSEVANFAISSQIECADKCLLEAVSVLYRQKHNQQQNFHPVLLAMCRIIMITPVEIIPCCIYKTNKRKAKFLHILTEMSSLHSSIFGKLFMNLLSRILDHDIDRTGRPLDHTLSEDHFLLLLPACLSYLNSISLRLGELNHKDFKHVPYFYSRILLKGFSQWKSFVSKDIFEEDYLEFFPSSVKQLLCLVDHSLLGKSLQMFLYHFALNGDTITLKQRLKLFKQIYPNSASHDELLDCNCQVIGCYSLHQSLNIINRVAVKISLCKILLFHGKVDVDLKAVSSEMGSKIETSRIRFINILVDVWHFIVKKFSLASDQSVTRENINRSSLYNYLEVFVLRNILELVMEMRDDLIQLEYISFLEQLFRSALLYRFHDPRTLKILQVLLTQLYNGKLSYHLYLKLLLAHSQLSSTIHSEYKLYDSSPSDYYLKPASSILKCLEFPSRHNHESDRPHDKKAAELSSGRLELIELLRILLLKNAHQSESVVGNDKSINYKELHSLLCQSYGATLSQIDLDIWKLIQEIEYISKSACESIVNAECLWGTAALKVTLSHPMEQCTSHSKVGSQETTEWSTSQLRENIPVDPDICTSTVLFFPYDRSTNDELLSVTKIQQHNIGERVEIYSSNVQVRNQYDPSFILRFSIYILSNGIIEPVDFATLRLLAIAFVSMSSPDLGIRKLAYESLGILKNALEKCQKKDTVGLRLLLTTVQNSIEESWQRIPSVIALFVAEASCILLNSSHDHFAAISSLLIHSSKLNLRVIPLFDNFLWSTSVNYKAERLWMLRLVYAGLNSDDDAMLYIKNSILESLMSFYMSPLSDFESKELVMEVIQKSVKLHKIACHLVKHCSLFSWFSSIISVTGERFKGGKERFFLKQVLAILKVVNDAISCGSILKWLRSFALEQLAELSSNIFNYLLHDTTLKREAIALPNPLLQMIVSLSKISQKRNICQPHFTLSMEGLFKIYQVVDQFNHTHVNPELALEAILMNAPPVSIFLMSKDRLESFLMWAISSALHSESSQKQRSNESRVDSMKESSEEPLKNSLVSKLLRWLTASVITGKLYQKSDYMNAKFDEPHNFNSLHSLLRHIENISGQRDEIRIDSEELVASTIFYLQLLLGVNYEVLPSVVSALCLLLFHAPDSAVGKTELLKDYDSLISSLCSRLQCPPEANPAWRWSFYQPWKDPSLELTGAQMMEQYHACQILLLIISNILGGRKLESAHLSHIDIVRSDVFKWERSLLKTDSSG